MNNKEAIEHLDKLMLGIKILNKIIDLNPDDNIRKDKDTVDLEAIECGIKALGQIDIVSMIIKDYCDRDSVNCNCDEDDQCFGIDAMKTIKVIMYALGIEENMEVDK